MSPIDLGTGTGMPLPVSKSISEVEKKVMSDMETSAEGNHIENIARLLDEGKTVVEGVILLV